MRIAIFLFLIISLIVNTSASAQKPVSGTGKGIPDMQQQIPDDNQSAMTDIFDIKGPEAFGVNPAYFKYGLYALIIILILALIAAGIIYMLRRQKKIEEITAQIAPDAAAYKELDELTGLEISDGREFYFRLSAILRNYISGRFNIDALEMTTEELIPRISEIGLSHEVHQEVKTFFYTSDPIKFADSSADSDKMQEDLMFIRSLVKKTTPEQPDNAQ